MEEWLHQMFTWLPAGKTYLAAIALIALMESLVAVGVIIPGSTLIVFTGFLALHGKEDIAAIITVSTVGAFLGDFASFWLGARFGPDIINSRMMRKQKTVVRKAEIFFTQHGGKSVFFGRFIGPIRGFVPFVAGCAQMKPRVFIAYGIVSAILWGLAYPGLGYLAGVSWQNVQRWSGRLSILIFVALAITVVFSILRKRYK